MKYIDNNSIESYMIVLSGPQLDRNLLRYENVFVQKLEGLYKLNDTSGHSTYSVTLSDQKHLSSLQSQCLFLLCFHILCVTWG